jgi:hypothetical protein
MQRTAETDFYMRREIIFILAFMVFRGRHAHRAPGDVSPLALARVFSMLAQLTIQRLPTFPLPKEQESKAKPARQKKYLKVL